MENNENFVAETENVEQTTEQTPRVYTQEEVDAMMGKRVARTEAKIRKEYERKYSGLTDVLKAGTGRETVEEMTDAFQKFYTSKGVKLPEKPEYSARDLEVLAKAEAQEFISAGFEDVVEEVDRLAQIGVEHMTQREKATFKVLAEHRQNMERSMELAELGVSQESATSKEFQDFAKKFTKDVPMSEIYELYKAKHPKEKPKTMGSMKNNSAAPVVKDYYSPEEAKKFTQKDYDNIPGLYEAVVGSMPKWRK